jgi:hypothetical protein
MYVLGSLAILSGLISVEAFAGGSGSKRLLCASEDNSWKVNWFKRGDFDFFKSNRIRIWNNGKKVEDVIYNPEDYITLPGDSHSEYGGNYFYNYQTIDSEGKLKVDFYEDKVNLPIFTVKCETELL